MNIEELEILFGQHPQIKAIGNGLRVTGYGLRAKGDRHVLVSGLHASARALALAQVRTPLFIVMDNAEVAQYLFTDLKTLGANVGFFPSSKRRRTIDDAAVIQRTECLTALSQERLPVTGDGLRVPLFVVTYPEAIAEPVPAKEELTAVSFQLSVGQEIKQSALSSQLADLGFEHVDFVFQPGQYAVRGSIVDIYSYSHDTPYRLDFFGDEIDSIREFDIEDQLSKNRVEGLQVTGNGLREENASIVEYLS